jgi:hypothetical protein
MMTITAVIDMNAIKIAGPLSKKALIICRVPPIVQTFPASACVAFQFA